MKADMQGIEKALDELDGILARMSEEEVTLEDSIALYAKAAELIAQTSRALADAQVQISQIDEKMEQLRMEHGV